MHAHRNVDADRQQISTLTKKSAMLENLCRKLREDGARALEEGNAMMVPTALCLCLVLNSL